MKSFLPIVIKDSPIKKLALLPLEKNSDEYYRGFEFQYIDGEPYQKGYRILCWRHDNYVDVYDDMTIVFQPEETFQVAENGLNQHVQVEITDTTFCNEAGKEDIAFTFEDIYKRKIIVHITEHTKRKSKPMNLLAPVGKGSSKPNYMPLFFMYDFDFYRRKRTQIVCKIGEKSHKLEKFPVTMNGQFRYYSRFSERCELVEFINTDNKELLEVELDEHMEYTWGNIIYRFETANALKSIVVKTSRKPIIIEFTPAFDITQEQKGTFSIRPDAVMGALSGMYEITKNGDDIQTRVVVCDGWTPVPVSFITKIILGKKSGFCVWSKNYELNQHINLNNGTVQQEWTNHN